VDATVNRASAAGLSWPLPVDVDDEALERRLYPPAVHPTVRKLSQPDWRALHDELANDKNKKLSLMLLWQEYKEGAPYGYQYISVARPRIISDNGPQFIAKDFKEFIRISGMTHVRTSPYYPQSNGKLERFHATIKGECIRPGVLLSLDDARRMVEGFIKHYGLLENRAGLVQGYVLKRTCPLAVSWCPGSAETLPLADIYGFVVGAVSKLSLAVNAPGTSPLRAGGKASDLADYWTLSTRNIDDYPLKAAVDNHGVPPAVPSRARSRFAV
jgi:hypothetical protein